MITTSAERQQASNEIFEQIKDCSTDLKITHDRFVDLFDVYKNGNFNFYIPPPKDVGHVADMVNVFLSKKTYKREGFLFTISLFVNESDPDVLVANIPAIGLNLWNRDWVKLHYITFKIEYAADILQAIHNYLIENLIVYCLNMIKDDAEVYESAYVKSLIAKARQAYAELQLIVQASSI